MSDKQSNCKNKEELFCMYSEPLTNPVQNKIIQPVKTSFMAKHEYRDVKIGENTKVTIDLTEIKKKMQDDFYYPLRSTFSEV